MTEWLEADPAVKTHAASSRVVSLVGGTTRKSEGLALIWYRRESRTAWQVSSASFGSRWMAEGWGRFERSSRSSLGSWWGLNAAGSESLPSGRASVLAVVLVVGRRVRVGDSIRQAQMWSG